MAQIYVAGSYARREELAGKASQLRQAGHRVTSRWLAGNAELPKQDQIDMDLVDLMACDTVMFFTEPESSHDKSFNTGGRHVEFGYALALNHTGDQRRIVVIGWPENLFHHDMGVEQYPNLETALSGLQQAVAA